MTDGNAVLVRLDNSEMNSGDRPHPTDPEVEPTPWLSLHRDEYPVILGLFGVT